MPTFYTPSSRMLFSASDTDTSNFGNKARAVLDMNPDTYETALLTSCDIKIDLDRTAPDTGGTMPWSSSWAGFVLPMYSSSWTSGACAVTSYTGSTYTTGGTSHGSISFYPPPINLLYKMPVTSAKRFWRFAFTGLSAALTVSMVIVGKTFAVSRMFNWESPVTRRAIGLDLSNGSDQDFISLTRSINRDVKTLYFELIDASDVALIQGAFDECHGPVLPFWFDESDVGFTYDEMKLYKFASLEALRIVPMAQDLYSVWVDVREVAAIPTGPDIGTAVSDYRSPF